MTAGRPTAEGGLPGTRRERSDAARNRRAILAATEELLAAHGPHVSIEQIAAAAGVGKGTVFHRFGSRIGLMRALMIERAQALEEAVRTGPPPLGEGTPDRERLLAFIDAVIDVVSRNKNLMAEMAYTPADMAAAEDTPEDERDKHPVYDFWHGHISALIVAQRPDADADMIAHLLLGALHSEPVLAQLAARDPRRLVAVLRSVTCAILDAPAGSLKRINHQNRHYHNGIGTRCRATLIVQRAGLPRRPDRRAPKIRLTPRPGRGCCVLTRKH